MSKLLALAKQSKRKLGQLVAMVKPVAYPVDPLLSNSRTQAMKKLLAKGDPRKEPDGSDH